MDNVCINIENNKEKIDSIIRKCDSAFNYTITRNNEYELLLDKIYEKAVFVCAYSSCDILGYCAIYMNDYINKCAFISIIAVCPKYQNNNIGKILINYVTKKAKEKGMRYCKLEVNKNNVKAIKFYKSQGFIEYKNMVNSYLMLTEL